MQLDLLRQWLYFVGVFNFHFLDGDLPLCGKITARIHRAIGALAKNDSGTVLVVLVLELNLTRLLQICRFALSEYR